MPTTCGFPNCKFRSRYRGQEDNRHFYRIPKRPAVLRQAWLNAISRSEETVVSQLRICSAHFYGGEKHEGDIPVADPQVDPPEFIELPPKESRTSERRTRLKAPSSSSSTPASMLISPSADRPQLPSIVRPNRRLHRGGTSLFPYGRFGGQIPGTAFGHQRAPEIGNIFSGQLKSELDGKTNPSTSCTVSGPLLPSQNCNSDPFSAANFALFTSLFSGKISSPNFHPNLLKMAAIHGANQLQNGQKPLVALLDGRDCSIEMPLLKDFATVAFCDAQSINDVHEKVLNEATAALLYQSIYLGREELAKFKALKVVIRIGSGTSNVDVRAATELGIAICHTPVECVEERADSTISLILNMFRRTFWMANSIQNGRLMSTNIDQLREQMAGSTRIRGNTLGLIGLGRVGTAVAIRAKAFGFRLLFHDPNLPPGVQNALGMETASTLTELLAKSDCISLHCPLGPESRHLINSENIKSLKFGAFLVNTSDFELIEPNALLAALKSGRIRAAAFDNIHEKGTQKEAFDLLCAQPNVICTGQSSWYSPESFRELREAAAQEVKRALIGPIPENLKHCINKGELIALKRILSFDKFVALNANNSNATNQNSSLFSSSPIFPQFPPLNGHLAKCQIGPNEIGHSISQITSSMRPFNELLNDSMANGHFGGANPLANYPLMMNPQIWQMAFLQNQQQKLTTNGQNVERNSSNLEEKSDEALEEKEEENGDQQGIDTENCMDEQKDDEELKEDMEEKEEEDGKVVEINEENGQILMEKMSKGNNGNVTSEFILAENGDQKIGNENGIDINENEGEENS